VTVAEKQMAWVRQIKGDFEYADPWARYTEIVGLVIKEVVRPEDSLAIHFTDGSIIMIRDDGQSCCESRYMTCDDDLTGYEGGQLVGIDTDAPGGGYEAKDDPDGYASDCHETQFVKVQTTKGSFTLCTHNEHNGYYGGFDLTVERVR